MDEDAKNAIDRILGYIKKIITEEEYSYLLKMIVEEMSSWKKKHKI